MASILFELSASLFDSILCIYFVMRLNHTSWKDCKYSIPAVIILFGVTVLFDYTHPNFSAVCTLVLFAVAMAFSLSIPHVSIGRAILANCLYKVTLILLSSALYSILSLTISGFDSLQFGSNAFIRIIYVCMHKVLLFSCLQLLIHIFEARTIMTIGCSIFTFLLSMATVVGLGVTMNIINVSQGNGIKADLIILILTFLSINVIFYFLLSMILRLQEEKKKLSAIEERLQFEQRHYQDMVVTYDELTKLRHDLKGHLTAISSYLEADELENCKSYISELLPVLRNKSEFRPFTGNLVVDYLIYTKLANAQDIPVNVSGCCGDLSDIKAVDLASLIGNIIDNAIEGEHQVNNPSIVLIFSQHNENRFICCKNKIEHSVLEHNPYLVTSKKDRHSHGIGHHIIADIVDKYNGILTYSEEEHMFIVSVILPTPIKQDSRTK